MRITEIDLQCEDIMWFAVDCNGFIIALTSGGIANVPEYVCRSRKETEVLEGFFLNKTENISDSELLIAHDDSPLVTDAISLSRKGIYCFDVSTDSNEYGYYKIAQPDNPLRLSDLPKKIQDILSDHIIDVDVVSTNQITVDNAY